MKKTPTEVQTIARTQKDIEACERKLSELLGCPIKLTPEPIRLVEYTTVIGLESGNIPSHLLGVFNTAFRRCYVYGRLEYVVPLSGKGVTARWARFSLRWETNDGGQNGADIVDGRIDPDKEDVWLWNR